MAFLEARVAVVVVEEDEESAAGVVPRIILSLVLDNP
jgi:hypothetical protein